MAITAPGDAGPAQLAEREWLPGLSVAELLGRGPDMATTTDAAPGVVRSLIPARIDRLPWSRFHTRLVILYVRRNLPESPRWLIMHGKANQAERAQIMPHRLFRNRMDAAAASAPGEARVESHSAASPNTVLHQITKGDTSGGMAADADSADGPMPPELEAKLIAPDEMP